jgi:Fe-S-cluster containining protein
VAKRKKWYKDGVRFECTQCGDCCRGIFPPDTFVALTDADIAAIAAYTNLSPQDFSRDHMLLSSPKGECVFLQGDLCSIHDARPHQCRSFPFWPRILASARAWKQAAHDCEGIGDGPLITEQELTARLRRSPKNIRFT